jgi:hypothetical protein
LVAFLCGRDARAPGGVDGAGVTPLGVVPCLEALGRLGSTHVPEPIASPSVLPSQKSHTIGIAWRAKRLIRAGFGARHLQSALLLSAHRSRARARKVVTVAA